MRAGTCTVSQRASFEMASFEVFAVAVRWLHLVRSGLRVSSEAGQLPGICKSLTEGKGRLTFVRIIPKALFCFCFCFFIKCRTEPIIASKQTSFVCFLLQKRLSVFTRSRVAAATDLWTALHWLADRVAILPPCVSVQLLPGYVSQQRL